MEEVKSNENNESKLNKETKVFAKGFCFAKIFILFLLGCIFGTYYEEILWRFTNGEWVNRQGLIFGPFSPIYGIGVSIFAIFLGKNNEKRSIIKTYLYSALIGGVAEFTMSWFCDVVMGVKFWDYTGYFLNIGGRTTIPFMLFWGLLGLILMKVIYPFLSKIVEKIPYKIAQPTYIVILVAIILDIVITYTAFGRMVFRDKGQEPLTFIGKFCDNHFSDEYMYHKFPAMRPD